MKWFMATRKANAAPLPEPASCFRGVIWAGVVCAFLVVMSAVFVDRPVATWIHAHLTDQRFDWFRATYEGHLLPVGPFAFMAAPAEALGPFAVILFGCLAAAEIGGWRTGARGQALLTLATSIFGALEINSVIKRVFGRTWPESWMGDNLSWIHDGVFGFNPFHGGSGWASFPSGHTTVMVAALTVLWSVWPRFRVIWLVIGATEMGGLLGGNYHFVSDLMGGTYLGWVVGLAFTALMLPSRNLKELQQDGSSSVMASGTTK